LGEIVRSGFCFTEKAEGGVSKRTMRFFRLLGVLYSVYLYTNLLLAIPPPSISNYNSVDYDLKGNTWGREQAGSIWERDVDQSQWRAGRIVETTECDPRVILNGDRTLEGLKISNSREDLSNVIELNNHKLVLGKEGLVLDAVGVSGIYGGALTSSLGQIKINSSVDTTHLTQISTAISDNGKQKVGVDLIRDDKGYGHRGVWLMGNQSNTFTGSFNIKGAVKLNLSKGGKYHQWRRCEAYK